MTTLTEAPYTTRTACRTCDAPLTDALDFGMHPLPDFTRRTPEEARAVARAPLALARCEGCGLVQLRHTVDRSALFGRTYPYRSGVNQSMRDHLRGLVVDTARYVTLKQGDYVVDIGCNDGTLMECWPKGVNAFGFEPSEHLAHACWDKGLWCVGDFFHADTYIAWVWARNDAKESLPARIVTSIAMFYDLDDPLAFCEDVARILAPDGVWVNEFNYLPTMLERVAFDMVGHEHLTYYTLTDIVRLYSKAGLEVFHAEVNGMNGGSLRVYAAPFGSREAETSVGDLMYAESEAGKGMAWFARRTEWAKDKVRAFLLHQVRAGKRVYVYGASTRGVTVLHHFGLDESIITAAAERNPDKWGCYIPGTGIPIVSEDEFREKADVGLVLPYTFMPEFQRREAEWLNDGGAFVVPVPHLKIIKAGAS